MRLSSLHGCHHTGSFLSTTTTTPSPLSARRRPLPRPASSSPPAGDRSPRLRQWWRPSESTSSAAPRQVGERKKWFILSRIWVFRRFVDWIWCVSMVDSWFASGNSSKSCFLFCWNLIGVVSNVGVRVIYDFFLNMMGKVRNIGWYCISQYLFFTVLLLFMVLCVIMRERLLFF